MDARIVRSKPVAPILTGLLVGVAFCSIGEKVSQAQTTARRESGAGNERQKDRSKTPGKTDRRQTAWGGEGCRRCQ